MNNPFESATDKRANLLSGETNALRLIDGAGDGLPGVIVETFAGRLLLSTTGARMPAGVRDWLEQSGRHVSWKRLDRHQKESPGHLCGPPQEGAFTAMENGAVFEISFQSGYSQGIFLDQRDNRAEVARRMRPGLKLLNTFAYTGAFSVAAARSGAETTTLDLSQPYLDWAKRNFALNGLDSAVHHFCKGDTFHWLRRFAKQGRSFDGIVLDPPTFSRDEKGKVFRVEENFGELAALAARLLAPGGWLLCCTNFRGITPAVFERQLLSGVHRTMAATHAPMPADFTDESYLKSVWLES